MVTIKQVKTSENKPVRDERGRLLPGSTANPNGRPVLPEEQKIVKKAVQEYIKEYGESLSETLPELSPVLKKMALGGDIQAIKELHDVVGLKQNNNPLVAVQINVTDDQKRFR